MLVPKSIVFKTAIRCQVVCGFNCQPSFQSTVFMRLAQGPEKNASPSPRPADRTVLPRSLRGPTANQRATCTHLLSGSVIF